MLDPAFRLQGSQCRILHSLVGVRDSSLSSYPPVPKVPGNIGHWRKDGGRAGIVNVQLHWINSYVHDDTPRPRALTGTVNASNVSQGYGVCARASWSHGSPARWVRHIPGFKTDRPDYISMACWVSNVLNPIYGRGLQS